MGEGFLSWTWRLFRCRGVSVELHLFYVIYVVINLIQSPSSWWYQLAWFVTILLHEVGHIAMARHLELRADRIVLWPLGGLAMVSPGRNRKEEVMIALAGPAVHVVIIAAIALYLQTHGVGLTPYDFSPAAFFSPHAFTPLQEYLSAIMLLNLFLFCFNVFLPAWPMDGGRVLVAVLSNWASRETTAKASAGLTVIISLAIMYFFDAFILGFFLLYDAILLIQAIQSGQVSYHPMFAFNPSRPYARKARRVKPAPAQKGVVLQFRPRDVASDARTCPNCQRAVPDKAVMCGFCEKEV